MLAPLSEPAGAPRSIVLVTRPTDGGDRTGGRLVSLGFVPLPAPLIGVRPLSPPLPRTVQAVLVTSGNALGAVRGWDGPLLAVGDATAARARLAGIQDVRSAAGDAVALVALAARTLRPDSGPLLLLSGAGQGEKVAADLRAAGFRVHRRVTYAASPVARFPPQATAAFAADTLHAAIFLSGETAAAFARLLPSHAVPHLPGVLALAIGKAAADALKPLPWRQVRTASTPTLDGVLALL